jgi:Fe-S cluster assembly iron-binding protein IscA
MLTVTERAAQELKEVLTAHATEPNQVLRLDASNEGFTLGVGQQVEGDHVVESEGTTVLHISAQLGLALASVDIVLDSIDTPDGPRLTVYRAEEVCEGGSMGQCDCGCEQHQEEQ